MDLPAPVSPVITENPAAKSMSSDDTLRVLLSQIFLVTLVFALMGLYGNKLHKKVFAELRNIVLLLTLMLLIIIPSYILVRVAPSLIYMIITWGGPLDLLPMIAFTVGTFAFWTNSAKMFRLSEIVCVSPAWLLYDFITGAYGGILTELVILGSVVISIIRFGWKGLDDPEFKK